MHTWCEFLLWQEPTKEEVTFTILMSFASKEEFNDFMIETSSYLSSINYSIVIEKN